ncbi:MAG: hypothetical protein IIA65_01110 [Planctomycetes bacterium]|nr:hypothetical protein [Planctomycetota bacterium]
MKSPKEFEEKDPLEVVSVFMDVPSEEASYLEMTRTFVEEYMLMGWSDDAIFELFQNPFYKATHNILQFKGEAYVKTILKEIRNG